MPIDPTDPKDIYLDDLQRRLQAAQAEIERLALLLCPPMPSGWRNAERLGVEVAAIEQVGGGPLRASIDRLGSILTEWHSPVGESSMTIGTRREVAAYLLGVVLRREGAVS